MDSPTSRDLSLALISHNDATFYAFHAVVLRCDNQGLVALAKTLSFMPVASISTFSGIIKEKVIYGSVALHYLPTEDQIADRLK